MNVIIERVPFRHDTYDVCIAQRAGRKVIYASGTGDDGELEWTTIDEGASFEPLFRCSKDVLEGLARALNDVTQSSDQTLEALADARQTRDRLLTMIEGAWDRQADAA